MHELKAELIADKLARFWMFPKGFYHTCFRFETARLAAAASQKLKKEKKLHCHPGRVTRDKQKRSDVY